MFLCKGQIFNLSFILCLGPFYFRFIKLCPFLYTLYIYMLFSAPTLSDRFKLQITYPKRNRPLSGLVKPFVHTPNYPCKPKKGGRVWNAFIVGAHWKCQQLLLFLAPCKIRYRHHLIRKGAIKWEYIYILLGAI